MYIATRVRLLLARRPWIYWSAVAVAAAAVAVAVQTHLAAADAARQSWADTVTVMVASAPHGPGDVVDATAVELPKAAVTDDALGPADLNGLEEPIARQHLATGEPITWHDVRAADGPAALADAGTVTVALTGQHGARVGLRVAVAADGLVLAESGRVVDVDGDIVFVAVDRADGASVAAASATGSATLLYLP